MGQNQDKLREVFFSFAGRLSLGEYWAYVVLLALIFGTAQGVVIATGGTFKGVPSAILFCVAAWPILAMQVKRCHDRNKSWSFVLLPLIPGIGALWFLIDIGLSPGTKGANRFGPDPRDPSSKEEAATFYVPAISSFMDVVLVMIPVAILLFLFICIANITFNTQP